MNTFIPRCIWICESAEWWVNILTEFLRGQSMVLRTFPNTHLLLAEAVIVAAPRFTLLGCAQIDADVIAGVAMLRCHHHEVVVLTAVENLSQIRSLFLSGAADVISRFADLPTIASIVESDLGAGQYKGRGRWMQPNV